MLKGKGQRWSIIRFFKNKTIPVNFIFEIFNLIIDFKPLTFDLFSYMITRFIFILPDISTVLGCNIPFIVGFNIEGCVKCLQVVYNSIYPCFARGMHILL